MELQGLQFDEKIWFPIKITNFINPHWFSFKLDAKLDTEINECIDNYVSEIGSYSSVDGELKIGDIVLVFEMSWNKWVRATVDLVIKQINGGHSYIVWLMDYG